MFGPMTMEDPLGGQPNAPLQVNTNMNSENDPDIFASRANQTAVLVWQERQRRQRTLRLLMMFLMILLLMDGDDQPDRRNIHHRNKHNLRRDKSDGGKWREFGILDGSTGIPPPIDPAVYKSRTEEDRIILESFRGHHPRYHELLRKNSGRDIESELRDWVGQKLAEESRSSISSEQLKSALDDGGNKAGNLDSLNDGIPSPLTQNTESSMNSESGDLRYFLTADATENEINSLDDMQVFHYPRNATGYYRGLWLRVPPRNSSINAPLAHSTKGSSEKNDVDDINNSSETTTDKTDGAEKSDGGPRTVAISDLNPWVQNQLLLRKEDVSVMLLPPNVYLDAESMGINNVSSATNLTTAGEQHTFFPPKNDDYLNAVFSSNSAFRSASSSSSTGSAPVKNIPSLSLTKEAGRAAFQLYSRPIPAMNELSIVDGLVKLYDGMTSSFVSRRTDVLLRVRGVMIHGIGKMSLVTSSTGLVGRRRSVLGVRDVESRYEGDHEIKTVGDNKGEKQVPESSHRHRRLTDRITELLLRSKNKESSRAGKNLAINFDEETLVKQIRNDAFYLYDSHFPKEILDESFELPMRRMEEEGWTLLHSIDQADFVDGDSTLREIDGQLKNTEKKAKDSKLLPQQSLSNQNYTSSNTSGMKIGEETSEGDYIARSILSSASDESAEDQIRRSGNTAPFHVYPFPYVKDNADGSIKKLASPSLRRLPTREQALESNALNCDFEINIDIQDAEWTLGEWRMSLEHRMRAIQAFDPLRTSIEPKKAEEDGTDLNLPAALQLKRSQYLLVKSQLDFFDMEIPKEALVMTLTGNIESTNCDFNSFVNVTAIRTNWEHTTAKAINYSFYMMLTCLTQIVVLLRQLLHTQAQSAASNVSLICVGWQTVLDAILCIGHIFLCLVMQPLFTAFASVAFFKLLIFCVIEMKYMAIIIQARNNSNNSGSTQEDLRRQITLLHLRFYAALMFAIISFWYIGQSHRQLYVMILYSFWVPQIVMNIITESRKPMHHYYIYGMALTRSIAPLYVFAVKNNFLKEVNPDFPTDLYLSEILVLWMGLQAAVLIAQGKYGTRFMIPQKFLPPKFDYSRPIPPSLLPRSTRTENFVNESSSEIELGPLLTGDVSPTRERSRNGVARNRRGGGNRTRLASRADEINVTTTMSTESGDALTLDCVICYNEIDVNDRSGYMLAPCDHIFHRQCLEQWMEVKMECPICRKELPSL